MDKQSRYFDLYIDFAVGEAGSLVLEKIIKKA